MAFTAAGCCLRKASTPKNIRLFIYVCIWEEDKPASEVACDHRHGGSAFQTISPDDGGDVCPAPH